MKTRAVLVTLVCLSRSAAAEEVTLDRTCVEIDEALDRLPAPDRDRATQLLRRVLERENLLVVASGCTETYSLSHEQTDTGYVIRLRSSAGKRRMSATTLDDLSARYERLVHSLREANLVKAQPAVAELSGPVEPLPTQDTQLGDEHDPTIADAPSHKRRMWYATIGGAFTGGGGIALGYRRVESSISLDIAYSSRSSEYGTEASTLGAEIMRNSWLTPSTFVYGGIGLSGGSTSKGSEYGDHYWGKGVHAELTAGLHIGAARGLQLLAQLDVTMPFYRVGNDMGQKEYAPLAVLSGGLGF